MAGFHGVSGAFFEGVREAKKTAPDGGAIIGLFTLVFSA
jgi:hypothetical protein